MKFKNLHEETITIITKTGTLTAKTGEFIELDEETYNTVKSIFTRLEEVKPEPKVVVEPVKEKPKAKADKKCK